MSKVSLSKDLLTIVLSFVLITTILIAVHVATGEPSLKPGDCVRKLGQNVNSKVHIIRNDTVEIYYEVYNIKGELTGEILFDVATKDGLVKVGCK